MRNSLFWWVLIGIMVMVDFYFFQALKTIVHFVNPRTKLFVFIAYWVVSASAILIMILLPYLHFEYQSRVVRNTLFACIAGLFFAKLIASVFFMVDDARRVVQWIAGKIYYSGTEGEVYRAGERISRSLFLSWTGMLVGGGLFGTLVHGFGNKYRYQVRKLRLNFDTLPPSFSGTRIVHISDIHSGSFTDKDSVKRGVDKIMDLNPDLVLFTGDLVNNRSDEMDDYMDIFSEVKAPMGVFSVLGNHDYGDYTNWDSIEEKRLNLEKLKQVHTSMGWRLLMDENLEIEKNGEKITLIGVQNTSAKARFHSYGNLEKAYHGVNPSHFKILLTHDPSHWDAEINKKYKDIPLTLSGHTHGFQFGVEIPGFKWSPVQYVYKHWAGHYRESSQHLYVNRGFGFIGYPGRVGILPEITMIELI